MVSVLGEPERLLTPEEAALVPHHVTRYYEDGRLVKVELVRDGRLRLIRYFDQSWPDELLLANHRRLHDMAPFEVLGPVGPTPHGRGRTVWQIAGDGTVAEYAEHDVDERGELLAERRFHPGGELFEHTEYEYGPDGQLARTRELGPDGAVLAEWESDD